MIRTRGVPTDADARKCQRECGARCCRYITVILPAPRSKWDLDEWGWFLAHESISIYFAGRRWRMEMRLRCRYLNHRNACTIYQQRPEVCRFYSQEFCEFSRRSQHLYHFDCKEEFDRWRENRRRKQKRQRERKAHAPRVSQSHASKGKARTP
jgi:hypothetical protein